jgi:hypothetical protein
MISVSAAGSFMQKERAKSGRDVRDATLVLSDKSAGAVVMVGSVIQRLTRLTKTIEKVAERQAKAAVAAAEKALAAKAHGPSQRAQAEANTNRRLSGSNSATGASSRAGGGGGGAGGGADIFEMLCIGAVGKFAIKAASRAAPVLAFAHGAYNIRQERKKTGRASVFSGAEAGAGLGAMLMTPTGPLGMLAGAVVGGAAGAAVTYVGNKIADAIVDWKGTTEFVSKKTSDIMAFGKAKWREVSDGFSRTMTEAGKTIADTWHSVQDTVTKYGKQIGGWLEKQGTNITEWLATVTTSLRGALNMSSLRDVAVEWLVKLKNWVFGALGEMFGVKSAQASTGGTGGVSGGYGPSGGSGGGASRGLPGGASPSIGTPQTTRPGQGNFGPGAGNSPRSNNAPTTPGSRGNGGGSKGGGGSTPPSRPYPTPTPPPPVPPQLQPRGQHKLPDITLNGQNRDQPRTKWNMPPTGTSGGNSRRLLPDINIGKQNPDQGRTAWNGGATSGGGKHILPDISIGRQNPDQSAGAWGNRPIAQASTPRSGGGMSPTQCAGMTPEQVERRIHDLQPHLTKHQCVDLAREFVGSKLNVHEWRKGQSVADGTLPPGTPLATFMNRDGSPSNLYDGGNPEGGKSGNNTTHAGVLHSYKRDANGKIIGIYVMDQYENKKQGYVPPHLTYYPFGDKRGGEKDGANYFAINDSKGNPIGDERNPLNNPNGQGTQTASAAGGSSGPGGKTNATAGGTSIALTGGKYDETDFHRAIIAAEGTARGGIDPYETSLGYRKSPKPLTQMTMKEAREWGEQIAREEMARKGVPRSQASSARGAFQIVNRTQDRVMKELGIGEDELFSKENQRRMAHQIYRNEGLGAWQGFNVHPEHAEAARRAIQSGAIPNENASAEGNDKNKVASIDPRTGGVSVNGAISDDVQMNRPGQYGGIVTVNGHQYHYGTGGDGFGSSEYGDHNITRFTTGAQRAAEGRSWTRNAFEIEDHYDEKARKTRTGVLIHPNPYSADDPRGLHSHGCFSIKTDEYPALEQDLNAEISKRGPMKLHVNPDGSAVIIPQHDDGPTSRPGDQDANASAPEDKTPRANASSKN